MDPGVTDLDAVFADIGISGFKFDLLQVATALGHGFSLCRTGGGFVRSFKRSAVPLRRRRTGFIRALQKFQHSRGGRARAASVFMHQQKFAELLMIKRSRRTHFLFGKALRRGRGIAVKRGIFYVAAASPPARTDYF